MLLNLQDFKSTKTFNNGVRRAGVMTIALFFTMVEVSVSEFQTGALN